MLFSTKGVGIDLGTKNITAALTIKRGTKWRIEQLIKVKNPLNSTFIKGDEERELLINCLTKLKEDLSYNNVVLGIPSKDVIFRNLIFPRLPFWQLREAAYWESLAFSSLFNGEYVSDFQVVESHPKTLRLLLAGVSKGLIVEYIKAFHESGLYIEAIDVHPLAKARLVNTTKGLGVLAFIDIDYSYCEIFIIEDGQLILNKLLDFKGSFIEGFSCPSMVTQDRSKCISMSVLEDFAKEVSRFFELYYTKRDLPKIVLTGNGSNFLPLKEVLKNHLNHSIITENDLPYGIEYSGLENGIDYTQFSGAIGFAMRR